MINIICLGKIKEKYLEDMTKDYFTRINHYHKVKIIELKDENNLSKEASDILKHIDPRDYVIVWDLNGDMITSNELAVLIDKTFITNSTIDFIIGSSEGLDDSIKKRANKMISFSKFTFPHGLFRGILLEQIYRAFKINNNETYHK